MSARATTTFLRTFCGSFSSKSAGLDPAATWIGAPSLRVISIVAIIPSQNRRVLYPAAGGAVLESYLNISHFYSLFPMKMGKTPS